MQKTFRMPSSQPLKIIRTVDFGSEAPYFVDMVKDHLLDKYSENELLSENSAFIRRLILLCTCRGPPSMPG